METSTRRLLLLLFAIKAQVVGVFICCNIGITETDCSGVIPDEQHFTVICYSVVIVCSLRCDSRRACLLRRGCRGEPR